MKRFLKMYGNRVSLDEIEDLLNTEGYECVCAGTDDDLKIDTEKELEERRAYLEEARSQETSD